jgi:16S rRNA (guanine527-N7)-methyltransferase
MSSDWLVRALEESRARGFLGPGSIDPHVEHARGFHGAWEHHSPMAPERFLDLGSGGGLPGFFLLTQWSTPGVLLDSMVRRTVFLEEALMWSDAPRNGSVVTARAEDASRDPQLAGEFDLVTARSFGPPSVTAECSVGFLKVGGLLIVSEPPQTSDSAGRWPHEGLAVLGLRDLGMWRSNSGFQVLIKDSDPSDRFPRRSGVPTKRPLF